MSSPSTTSVRRRIALATGAGALVLLGGGGVAYAASSIDDSVETGWSTVVDADPASTGDTAQARDQQDCPDLSDQSQADQSQADPSQADPSQADQSQADQSQDGEL
jgi:hypothetical protein